MRAETERLFELFDQAALFAHCGEPLDDPTAIVVESWDDALEVAYFRNVWADFRLEQSNQYRERPVAASHARFQRWNEVVGALRPVVFQLIADVLPHTPVPETIQPTVRNRMEADLLLAFAEHEFVDVVPVGFHSYLADWYLRGRFPCGWTVLSKEPGRLIVY